ncbi:MAG: protein kinase [Gemmatimonadota bacterium]
MEPRLATALEGRYVVDREIGRGGMATVYLARDVRHNRQVALKVLNPELGAVLGVERFLAEIEVTANLQHPNLLPLFDSGEVNGLLFYVMPYVEGESLRARLDREKQLPVEEAVRIAVAIAGALDYAHRHKVVHRDLKPENILLHEGQPLIADFGIALAVSNAGGSRITQTGLSLGTPHYMSPEQATGDRVVDGRTDIYSLGAMMFEMLVGDPPHMAGTTQAVIAKVLTERPVSVRASRPNVPAHVEAAIGRSLEKLAADRFATAKEFADVLSGKGAMPAHHTYVAPQPVATIRPRAARARELAPWALVVLLAGGLGWQVMQPSEMAEAPVVRVNFDMPPGARVNEVLTGSTIAVSPKGDMIAFTSVGLSGFRMYVRRINELSAREIGDASIAGRNLTFSPDGRFLAFTEGNVLKKVSVDGGEIIEVAPTASAVPYGLSWSEADTIYIGSFSGLWKVPANGGTAVQVQAPDSSTTSNGRRWPLLLPDGKTIVHASGSNSAAVPHLAVLDLRTGKSTEFEQLAAVPLGIRDDHLVYVSPSGGLMTVRFDHAAHKPIGEPLQLDDGVLIDPTAGAKAALSSSGTLAYLRGRAQYQPVLVAPGGTAATPLVNEPGTYQTPRYSPDGKRVAVTKFTSSATDIYIYDIALNTFQRLTTEGTNVRPEWVDDSSVVFVSLRGSKSAIWRQATDGSEAELLYQPEVEPFEAIVSPDMQWLVIRTAPGAKYPRDILAVPMTGEKKVVPLVTSRHTESLPRFSPNGKWLVYQSNETGRFEVYVRPFPGSGGRVPVSDNGGTEPIFSRSGRSLFYKGPLGEIIEVGVTTEGGFSIGQRKVVLTGDYLPDSSHPNWDVSPDGRFLMLKRAGAEAQTIVVHNWGRELREKAASRR